MDPEPTPIQTSAEMTARQDRLEQQVAELSRKLAELERQVARPETPLVSTPLRSTPPPPQISAPLSNGAQVLTPPPVRASLENRLGSQVFNRVGIIALLIGSTWFLKLAVDNQWIGAIGRVLIGLLAGAALILWSERFRRSGYPAFSFSLKALGGGVLYLALWAAFQLYHLVPAAVALAAMLLVTAWNAWMAWSQNAELLAVYALAGGLATPLLLSTGGNHEIFLFTYLLALDIACVALSRLRFWPSLLAISLPATAAYFIGWYTSFYAPSELLLTSLFVVLFFAVFNAAVYGAGGAAVPPAKYPRIARLIPQVLLPIANAAFVSLALYSVLQDSGNHELLPWLMVALAAVYLGLMRLPQPPITAAIHLSLAVVFLTIAIPLKASGAWITIGWLVEGVALLWVSTQFLATSSETGRILRILASAALLLGFAGIMTELIRQSFLSSSGFFNRGFVTALIGLASFALAIAIGERTPATSRISPNFAQIAAGALIAFNLSAILAGVVQINLLFVSTTQNADATLQRALATSAFLMLYGALLLAVGFWQRSAFIRWQALLLLVFTIAKTFLYDMRNLSQGYRVLSFLGLGALLMAVSFAYQKDWLALREPAASTPTNREAPE